MQHFVSNLFSSQITEEKDLLVIIALFVMVENTFVSLGKHFLNDCSFSYRTLSKCKKIKKGWEREVPQKESNEEEWEQTSAGQTRRDHHAVGRLEPQWSRYSDYEVEEPFSQQLLAILFPAQALSTLDMAMTRRVYIKEICVNDIDTYIESHHRKVHEKCVTGPRLFPVWSEIVKRRMGFSHKTNFDMHFSVSQFQIFWCRGRNSSWCAMYLPTAGRKIPKDTHSNLVESKNNFE